MNIEFVPVSSLRPNANNARTHSARQIRKIAKSIKAFGFNNPVLADDAYMVIAGHGRLEAAKQLKMATVPVLRLSHMTKEQVRAYVLADNKLALEAGWDREILAIELQGLIDLNFEVELTGFETAEIDLVLGDAVESQASAATAEDNVPAPSGRPTVTRSGDVWILIAPELSSALFFATSNSLKSQAARNLKSPFGNIRAVTFELCSRSRPT
jgi:ParB-like chromosome segregation protein Spo0J